MQDTICSEVRGCSSVAENAYAEYHPTVLQQSMGQPNSPSPKEGWLLMVLHGLSVLMQLPSQTVPSLKD